MICCLLPLVMASGQEQQAQKLLSEAIYQEEVNGDIDAAMKAYQLIISNYPDQRNVSARALLRLGVCYEKLGSEHARQTYQDVISKYSDQLNEATMAKDRIARLEAYTAELAREAEKHLKAGNDLFKRWEYDSAIEEYEKAVSSGPNTDIALNARYYIGQSWFRAGKYDEALAVFTRLIEDNPTSPIAPVTELMVAQVKQTMQEDKSNLRKFNSSEQDTIVDRETGIKFTKIKSFVGKNDLISYTGGGFNLSPDARFMLLENQVIPVDGSDAFKLVEMDALRAVYAPGMKKAAFYADSAIWIVPVSHETGRTTGEPSKLVTGRYRYQYPVSWSPNGEEIAFIRADKEFAGTLWTVSVSDGKLTLIADESGSYLAPAWSPDGKTIACWKKKKEIWLYPAEKGEPEKLMDNGGLPVWSPDGEWLYHFNWDFRKLFRLSDNRNIDLITPQEVGDFIGFSLEGKKMLFYCPSYETRWGFRVTSSSGGPSFEPAGNIDVYNLNWASDSRKVFVQSENSAGDIIYRIIPLGAGKSYVLNTDTDTLGKVIPFDISPDEKNIAFTVTRADGTKDLYIAPFSVKDARTTSPARMIFEGWSVIAFNVDFSWSEDGSKLALIHKNDIWIVHLSECEPLRLTNTTEQKRWIRWSPDGEMLSYFTDYDADKTARTLKIIPATGGISRKIFENCSTAAWSSDSKQFSIYANRKIFIVSNDGSNVKELFSQDDLNLKDLSSAIWSPNGKNLAFLGYSSELEESYLFMISLESREITRLAPDDNSPYKYSLRWSPDGKWLSYLTEDLVKVRFEGTMWEADFNEIVEKLGK